MDFIPFHEYRQLVFKVFFKGRSLLEETQYWNINETATFLVKASLCTLLFAELAAVLVDAISMTGWFYFDLLYAALGVGLGLLGGIGWGLAWGVPWGIVWSLALGLGVGAAMGLESHYAWDWVWGISMGSMLGAASSTTGGANMALFGGVATGVASGLVSSFILGKAGGFAWGLSFLIVYLFTWSRWFYLPVFLFALVKKIRPGLLPTHWDENIHAPVPGLKTILVRMASKDEEGRQEAMNEAVFLSQARPAQRHAAQQALVEIVASEIAAFREIDDIANLRQILDFFPNDTDVLPQNFIRGFENLLEFSELAFMILKNPDLSESLKELETLTLQVMRFQKKMDTGKSGTDRQFLKIATVWLAIVGRAAKSLEQRAASLMPNPFIVGKPLKPGSELFVGREQLIREIHSVAAQIRTVGAIVLLGDPQIGKSSLLINLKAYPQPDVKIVYIDCKDKITSESLRFFCKTTAKSVHRAIGRQTKFNLMCSTLTDLCKYLRSVQCELEENNFRLLLCFDHYEKLSEKIQMRDFAAFPKALRFWIQRLPRTTVLIAGSRSPEQITQVDWAQNLGNFRVIHVRALDVKSALKLATQPVEEIGLKYVFGTEGLNAFVLRLGCHPFLIQAALSELINHLNSEGKKEADTEDIDKALNSLLTSANRFFDNLWNTALTDEEQKLLSSIAQNQSVAQIQSVPRSAYETIDSLTSKAILRGDDSGYRFRIPLFQDWIAQRFIQ